MFGLCLVSTQCQAKSFNSALGPVIAQSLLGLSLFPVLSQVSLRPVLRPVLSPVLRPILSLVSVSMPVSVALCYIQLNFT